MDDAPRAPQESPPLRHLPPLESRLITVSNWDPGRLDRAAGINETRDDGVSMKAVEGRERAGETCTVISICPPAPFVFTGEREWREMTWQR